MFHALETTQVHPFNEMQSTFGPTMKKSGLLLFGIREGHHLFEGLRNDNESPSFPSH